MLNKIQFFTKGCVFMSYCDGRDFNDNGCLDSVTDRTARFNERANERVRERIASQEEIYSCKQCNPIVFCEHPVQVINPVTDCDNPFKIEKPFSDYARFVMESYDFHTKPKKT